MNINKYIKEFKDKVVSYNILKPVAKYLSYYNRELNKNLRKNELATRSFSLLSIS